MNQDMSKINCLVASAPRVQVHVRQHSASFGLLSFSQMILCGRFKFNLSLVPGVLSGFVVSQDEGGDGVYS